MPSCTIASMRAWPNAPRDCDGNGEQQDEREHAKGDQRVHGADRPIADQEKNLVHGSLVADSPANTNEEGTFMVNERRIFMVNGALKIMVSGGLTGSRS